MLFVFSQVLQDIRYGVVFIMAIFDQLSKLLYWSRNSEDNSEHEKKRDIYSFKDPIVTWEKVKRFVKL